MIKVLYIEDDPDDAVIVRRFLNDSKNQFLVEVVGSGAEAREKLDHKTYDCVLLDQNLPDTNGLVMLQDIKSNWPDTPVLMLTGQKDERLSLGSSKLGADDFIIKDEMNTQILSDTIYKVIHIENEIEVIAHEETDQQNLPEKTLFKENVADIYETLVSTMTEGMISLDLNQTILFANQQAGDMLKGSANTLLGIRAHILFDKAEYSRFQTNFKRTISGESNKYEASLRCLDGTQLPVIVSQSPYYDRRHTLAGCLMVITDISERKIAEGELIRSEKRFRDIAENTTDLIWEMDSLGRFTYVNQMVKHILGFEPEEVIGKQIDKFVIASIAKNLVRFTSSEMRGRVPVKVLEARWRNKRGHEICLEMSRVPIYDPIGEIIGYRGISRDITARKKREEKQNLEREFDLNLERCISRISKNLYEIENFEEAINVSLDYIGKIFKADHCFLYFLNDGTHQNHIVNNNFWKRESSEKNFTEYYDFALEKFPAWRSHLSINKHVAIKESSHVHEMDKAEQQFLMDHEIGSLLLVPFFIHDIFYGIFGIDFKKETHEWRIAEIAAIRTITENISKVVERKHARTTLLQQKAKFESVIRSTGDGIILLDKDCQIALINPAARKILRLFIKSKNFHSPLKKLGEISIEEILHAFEKEKLNSITREISTTIGMVRFFTIVFSTVKSIKDEIAGMVVNLHEITEIRQAQEQLLHSSKLASLGQLTAGVAHELNNPLTYMLGYTELLLATQTDPENKTKLGKILDGGRRVKNIIDNMLEFSHNQTLFKELSDITKIIDNTIALMGRRLSNQNIKLIKTLDRKLSLVYCNKGELQQVFLNLIQNAFDEIVRSKKGDKIEIVTKQISKEKIRLKFIDNGPGMSTEVRQRIFDPFYTTKAPGEGTGLGLSISYKIIEKHEGKISVKSEPGKGSTFIIELPTKLDEATNSESLDIFSLEKIEAGDNEAHGKILILEDSTKSESIAKILYRTKNKVATCSDFDQALMKLGSENMDLFFIDIKQLKQLKQYIQNGTLHDWKKRIIFMFDYPMNETVKTSLISKGIGCIAKPFKVDEVMQTVVREMKFIRKI